MALSKCRRCGHPVAVDVRFCPGCGLRNPAPSTATRILWIVILGVFVLVTLALAFRAR